MKYQEIIKLLEERGWSSTCDQYYRKIYELGDLRYAQMIDVYQVLSTVLDTRVLLNYYDKQAMDKLKIELKGRKREYYGNSRLLEHIPLRRLSSRFCDKSRP